MEAAETVFCVSPPSLYTHCKHRAATDSPHRGFFHALNLGDADRSSAPSRFRSRDPRIRTLRLTRRRQENRRGLAAQRGAKPRSVPRPACLDPIRAAPRRRSHRELLQRRPEPKRRTDLLSSELYLDQQFFYRPRSRQRHVRSHPPRTISLGELHAIAQ